MKQENKTYKIKSMVMNIIYSHDLEESIKFYEKYFGFEILKDLGRLSVYGRAGEIELWIIGGFNYSSEQGNTSHTSVVYFVNDLSGLFKKFKLDDIIIVQEEPIKTPSGMYWFQALDPSGNIIELMGDIELRKLNF